jgi:hypothetical protein
VGLSSGFGSVLLFSCFHVGPFSFKRGVVLGRNYRPELNGALSGGRDGALSSVVAVSARCNPYVVIPWYGLVVG